MARGQIVGTMMFLCPYCYKLRSYRITPEFYKFRCKNMNCREVFYWAPRVLRACGRKPKLDMTSRVFPEWALEEYRENLPLVEDEEQEQDHSEP